MSGLSPNFRGIALMVLATGAFSINDTFLKLAVEDMPPFQALFLRGVMSCLWGIPLLGFTGNLKHLPLVLDRGVLGRNVFELIAVFGFILALAYMPIADVTAIGQLAPMLVLVGAALFFGEKMGRLQLALVVVAFAGALLVAQPGAEGFSIFALFAFWNAVASAGRDIAGRKVGASIPGLVVAMGAGVVVLVGAGIATLVFEDWQAPDLRELGLIACSGLFLMFGHFFIFSSYRAAPVGIVVPFLYTGTIWALISGALVFHTLPNLLAITGIALILVSGVVVVMSERWKRKVTMTA